ncbi:MAG: hypothetical protein QG608_3752 [Actinomycetota bacterium]|nr:hypothetical protein [Actinomycetota bacterium]
MESRNPVFSRTEGFTRGGYATFDTPTAGDLETMYTAPPAGPLQTGRMTLDDVVVRTASVFGVLLLTAAATYTMVKPENFGIVVVAALVGLGLGLVNSFKKEPSPALILLYGAVEGIFVGGVSKFYETRYEGIVAQAVLGTLAAFITMLALYRSGKIRNTPKFQRTLLMAGLGYMVFVGIHLLGVMLNAWDSIYAGGGVLAVLVSAFGVVLATFFLILDFDFVEQGVRNGLPAKYAWTAAFGLVVTLIWLYLELLRLIAILRGDD